MYIKKYKLYSPYVIQSYLIVYFFYTAPGVHRISLPILYYLPQLFNQTTIAHGKQ